MSRGDRKDGTLIVPAFNEERFIADCLTSAVTDPGMEVLVVDGGSTDDTRAIVRRLQPRYPGLRLLHNPRRNAASAMNIGLAHATGEFVARLDAHSVYPPGYVRRLIDALREHGADVAGGVCVTRPRRPTLFGRAVAASLTNRWVMGNTGFRVGGGHVREVDTVPFGCWRAEALRAAGGYDETLHRSQDYELSQRLRQTGAKIILVPDVVIEYQARSGLWENIRYTFFNGYWVGFPLVANGVRFAARHLVPGAACLAAVTLLSAAAASASPWPLLPATAYLVVLALSAAASARHGVAVALCLPPITAGTHLLYGLGTLYGLVRGVISRTMGAIAGRDGAATEPAAKDRATAAPKP